MTGSTTPPPAPDRGYSVDAAGVTPVSVSSPLAPFIAEKKRSSAFGLLLGFALVVAVGGVAFAAGRLTAPAPAATATGGLGRGGNGTGFGGGTGFGAGASGGPGGAGLGGGGAFGGSTQLTVAGTVQSISATSISLTLADGTTIQIPIDASTTYHGQSSATSADVKTGQQVDVAMSGFGGLGRGGGQGGAGANASAPPPVGGAGASPGTGAGASGGLGGGRGIAGPARSITIVTP